MKQNSAGGSKKMTFTSTPTTSMKVRKDVTAALQAWKKRQDEEDAKAAAERSQAQTVASR